MDRIYIGNAVVGGKDTRGWIVGNFIPEGIRHSNEVECTTLTVRWPSVKGT